MDRNAKQRTLLYPALSITAVPLLHGCVLILPQALAEKEGDGMAKMLYRKDTGEILGVHIIGLHAADLIHEASNAIATKQTVQVGLIMFASGSDRVCMPGACRQQQGVCLSCKHASHGH